MSDKVVAIGDVHGCSKSLQALWKKLEPYSDYTHVFIGDYIDRGPDSKGVVDFLLQVQDERPTVFLQGNHELMLLNAFKTGDARSWMLNGGQTTLDSYGLKENINDLPDDHLEFFIHTKLIYETDSYFFSHAGAPPHQTLAESKSSPEAQEYFLWGREHLNAFDTPWEKTAVFGHTPRAHPIRKNNMIGIDTGCVFDKLGYGKLTAVVLPEENFIQQISLD